MPGEFISPEQIKAAGGIQKNDHTLGVVIFLELDSNLDIFDISKITSQFFSSATRRFIVTDYCRKSKYLFGALKILDAGKLKPAYQWSCPSPAPV